jgi:hypothetical protein
MSRLVRALLLTGCTALGVALAVHVARTSQPQRRGVPSPTAPPADSQLPSLNLVLKPSAQFAVASQSDRLVPTDPVSPQPIADVVSVPRVSNLGELPRAGAAPPRGNPPGADAIPELAQTSPRIVDPNADPKELLAPLMQQALERIRQSGDTAQAGQPADPGVAPLPAPRFGAQAEEDAAAAPQSRIALQGDDQLEIYIPNRPIHEVLALLSKAGAINILPSKNVQGMVSASLSGVSAQEALDAILRSTGYVAHREGQFVYVGTPQDFEAMRQVRFTGPTTFPPRSWKH